MKISEKTERNKVHTIYLLKDSTRVPSVTTYLGILDKPAIVHWAWTCGVEGLDYRKVRDQSANIGTFVHAKILSELSGRPMAEDEFTEADKKVAKNCMRSWHRWKEGKTLEPILLEKPLVSETYRFGGTPDFYGKVDGKLFLLDFKTSGGIYPEYYYQLAAYWVLLEENGYEDPTIKILRIGKEANDDVEERELTNLEPAWKIFLACQQIYELRKKVKSG